REVYLGGCLCGAVRYEVSGPLADVNYCHCGQCQKSTGHYYASTQTTTRQFRLTATDGLKWYRSSDWAERGFCSHCGSPLFWRRVDSYEYSFLAGSLDGHPPLKGREHIFVDYKKSYYSLDDGLPQHATYPPDRT